MEEYLDNLEVQEELVNRLVEIEKHYSTMKVLRDELDEQLDLKNRIPYSIPEVEAALVYKFKHNKGRQTSRKFCNKVMKKLLEDETRSVSPIMVADVFGELVMNGDIVVDTFGYVC